MSSWARVEAGVVWVGSAVEAGHVSTRHWSTISARLFPSGRLGSRSEPGPRDIGAVLVPREPLIRDGELASPAYDEPGNPLIDVEHPHDQGGIRPPPETTAIARERRTLRRRTAISRPGVANPRRVGLAVEVGLVCVGLDGG